MGRFLDAYKPERHYMRGPGPKWHAKHSASLLTAASAQPAGNHGAALKELRAAEFQLLGWMAPMAAAVTLGFMAVMVLA
ncbi:hypothetical protein AUC70_13700 [Methyloceanibacter stevinii]|uniref:Uncharacterized protein n=1 Tax=Methyloceanibacter stevinii TaxID=1774970 RepID=A0A1E3VU81_9HYPH|nr:MULTISPECIES: hypothetical protein [Methyloceanibacter]ODR96841.1 hypothetical protein AUC70_13700 [Methyloceanibacter stevinii]